MGLKIVVLAAIVSIVMSGSTAQASHEDLIHGPCGAKTGYIHMTVAEVDDKVKQRIADGIVDADSISRSSVDTIVSGTPHDLLISAGVIQEYAVNRFDQVLRYDDSFWGGIANSSSKFTEWETGCYGLTYMLSDAEDDGYPRVVTRQLLSARYVQGSPNKYHFDLDIAVEFLQLGGNLSGLDNVWNFNG
jgi:hypothetical protein